MFFGHQISEQSVSVNIRDIIAKRAKVCADPPLVFHYDRNRVAKMYFINLCACLYNEIQLIQITWTQVCFKYFFWFIFVSPKNYFTNTFSNSDQAKQLRNFCKYSYGGGGYISPGKESRQVHQGSLLLPLLLLLPSEEKQASRQSSAEEDDQEDGKCMKAN